MTLRLELAGLPPFDLEDFDANGLYVASWDVGFPEVRGVVRNRPRLDGVIDDTANVGARLVSITGTVAEVEGYSRRDVVDRLRLFSRPGVRPYLYFSEELGGAERRVLLRADAQSAPIERPGSGAITASWRSVFPYLEAASPKVLGLWPAGAGAGGRAYDRTFDQAYPVVTGGGNLTATNGGSAPAEWVARIFGPVTTPVLTNVTTSESLTFSGLSIASGDYLTVDSYNRTAFYNGDTAAPRLSYLNFSTSSWWTLAPGDNVLRFAPTSFSGAAQVELTYRDTYL